MSVDVTSIDSLPNENTVQNVKLQINENAPPPTELSKESINQIVNGIQEAAGSNLTALPSRDIPTNTNRVTIDPNVQVNYIPNKSDEDYIKDDEDFNKIINRNTNSEYEQDHLDNLYDEMQTPVLIMTLYFIFQLPYVQKLFVKYAPSLYSKDGNPNFTGYIVKTLLFGFSFYSINKLTKYMSEI